MIKPGKNIAIKVPAYKCQETVDCPVNRTHFRSMIGLPTVEYYPDRVGLAIKKTLEQSIGFEFGEMTLWLDRVEKAHPVQLVDRFPQAHISA